MSAFGIRIGQGDRYIRSISLIDGTAGLSPKERRLFAFAGARNAGLRPAVGGGCSRRRFIPCFIPSNEAARAVLTGSEGPGGPRLTDLSSPYRCERSQRIRTESGRSPSQGGDTGSNPHGAANRKSVGAMGFIAYGLRARAGWAQEELGQLLMQA